MNNMELNGHVCRVFNLWMAKLCRQIWTSLLINNSVFGDRLHSSIASLHSYFSRNELIGENFRFVCQFWDFFINFLLLLLWKSRIFLRWFRMKFMRIFFSSCFGVLWEFEKAHHCGLFWDWNNAFWVINNRMW